MRKIMGILAALCLWLQASGAEKKYAFSEIPEELKVASEAILRNHEQKVVLKPGGAVEHQVVMAITILGESGDNWAEFYGPYDKYTKIRNLSGQIYDAEGKRVELIKNEDILDLSAISSYSLYEDNRVKIIDADYHSYPYTVEYSYTYLYKTFLELPDWRVYDSYNMAIERTAFEITAPSLDDFRYRMENCEVEPEISEEKGSVRIRWELKNLPALTSESLSKSLRDLSPVVYIGPNDFNYGGKMGSMETWQDFGSWVNYLAEGKRELSDEEQAHVLELTKDLDSTEEKIRVLYKYMQGKVRYVNIALGVGGFEPIDAMTVSRVGYGDCKALSNYMYTLLDAAGISSRYTLVRAGSSYPDFREDFPSQQFNHVILAVPLENDTMWLECTSQRLPAGYVGSFTDNRPALMVDEEGGRLVRTPGHSAEENLVSNHVTCLMNENLDAEISYVKTYEGVKFGDMQSLVYNYDHEEQKRHIQDGLHLADLTVNDFSFDMDVEGEPVVTEKASVSVRQMIPAEGEYISLPLGSLSADNYIPKRTRNRKYDVFRRRGYSRKDTVIYHLPPNMKVHSVPEAVRLETDYGIYTMEAMPDEDSIVYVRSLVMYAGEYPAEEYNSVYRFYRQISTAEGKKALLVKR